MFSILRDYSKMCIPSKVFFFCISSKSTLEFNHVICRSKYEKVDQKHNNKQIYAYLAKLNRRNCHFRIEPINNK
jgi:hypothetical protein